MKLQKETIDIIAHDLTSGDAPFLAGEVGIGKTEILQQVAASLGGVHFTVDCGMMSTKEDLNGLRTREVADHRPGDPEHEQYFVPHVDVVAAIRHANANPDQTVVLILDEINRVDDPGVTNAATAMILEHRVGNLELPTNIRLAATGNVHGHIVDLDDAAVSRLTLREIEPDAGVWLEWMDTSSQDVHPAVRSVLTEHPELIWGKGVSAVAGAISQRTGDEDEALRNQAVAAVSGRTREVLQIACPRTIKKLNSRLITAGDDLLREWDAIASSMRDPHRQLLGITLLEELVRGYTGNTPFTTALVDEVRDIINPPVVAQISPVGQPAPFTDAVVLVLDAADLDEVSDIARGMSTAERDEVIIYLLEDDDDRAAILEAFVDAFEDTDSLGKEAHRALSERILSERINLGNFRGLVRSGSTIAYKMSSLYETLIGESL